MCLCAQTPTHMPAWTQMICQRLSVFCSDNYRNEGWMMKRRVTGRRGEKMEENLACWSQTKVMAAMPLSYIKQWHKNMTKKLSRKMYLILKLTDSSVGTMFKAEYHLNIFYTCAKWYQSSGTNAHKQLCKIFTKLFWLAECPWIKQQLSKQRQLGKLPWWGPCDVIKCYPKATKWTFQRECFTHLAKCWFQSASI